MFGQNNRNMNGLLVNKLKQSKRKDKLRKLNNIVRYHCTTKTCKTTVKWKFRITYQLLYGISEAVVRNVLQNKCP